MQQSEFEKIRMDIGRKIKNIFGNRIRNLEFFDIVEVENHWAFKLRFIAYDYFVILFNYDLDVIGFSIEISENRMISILNEHVCYSDVDLEQYIQKVKSRIELRIPDKYLIECGWK
ncbi:hypothetical protein [Eubacterium sp.]